MLGQRVAWDQPLGDGKMHPWNGPFLPSSRTSARRFLANCRRQRFAKGDVVFHAGDPAESLNLVATGRLAVWSFSEVSDATLLGLVEVHDANDVLSSDPRRVVARGQTSLPLSSRSAAMVS